MSRLNKLTLALAAVVVFAFTAPTIKADVCGSVGGNLVANCGFETGTFAGWTNSGNTGFTGITSGSAHSGTFDASFGPVGSLGFLTQNIATTPGGTYNLSFWLINPGGTPNEWSVSFNGVSLLDVTNAPAFGYTLFSFSGLVATGASTQLQFGFRQDPSFWRLDDVVVTRQAAAVPEPMTLLLLGTGLTGVVAKLRRRKLA